MSFCTPKKRAEPSNHHWNKKTAISKEKTLSDWVKDYLKHYENCYPIQAQWWGDQAIDWDAALEEIEQLRQESN